MTYDAVFFISFGGPEKQDDVMPFLDLVTEGRGIPRERLLEVAEHYRHMGGRSPINEITLYQAQALEKELFARKIQLPVYIGQRHWHPFIEDTLRRMKTNGVKRAIGFTTAAHRCEASLERYIQAVEKARAAMGPDAPIIDYVDPWFDHPLFIQAIAERVQDVLRRSSTLFNAPWYFIAHSIPCGMAKNSAYVPELKRTLELVCARLGKPEGKLAYSSRSGRPSDPWLIEDVNDVIRAEAAAGRKEILFITIGFVADHVEVLFDQDVEAQATAHKAGIRLYRTQTVGDHAPFIRMMADVILARAKGSDLPIQTHSTPMGAPTSPFCFCYPGADHPPCQLTKAPAHVR